MNVERMGNGPTEQVEPQAMFQDSRKGTKVRDKPVFDWLLVGSSRSPFRRGRGVFHVIKLFPF